MLLPLSAFQMKADDENAVKIIPLEMGQKTDLSRSITGNPIESYYYGMFNSIFTKFNDVLGNVSISVTNHATGETWFDMFDSKIGHCFVIQISGAPGTYEVVYITESGYIYEGCFNLDKLAE